MAAWLKKHAGRIVISFIKSSYEGLFKQMNPDADIKNQPNSLTKLLLANGFFRTAAAA
jgi:hypothetical protein